MTFNYTEALVDRSFTCGRGNLERFRWFKPLFTGIKSCLVRKYLSQVIWRISWRNQGFGDFMYVIITVYYTNFESLITYRSTYVSKRAYSCCVVIMDILAHPYIRVYWLLACNPLQHSWPWTCYPYSYTSININTFVNSPMWFNAPSA